MTTSKDYSLALSIAPDRIGYAAIDNNFKVIHRDRKRVVGVSKFTPGETAEETRLKRTSRRNTARRRRRIGYLNDFFAPHLAKIDPDFLHRLKYSFINNEGLFSEPKLTAQYLQKYPTIYHLRQTLMTEKRQFDLRLVYLAIHHLVKYRGHFLSDLPMASFAEDDALDLDVSLQTINSLLAADPATAMVELNADTKTGTQLKTLLLDKQVKKGQLKKAAVELLINSGEKGKLLKLEKQTATAVVNAITGDDFSIDQLYRPETPIGIKLNFGSETFDQDVLELGDLLTSERQAILQVLERMYSRLVLERLVPDGKSISQAKIEAYDRYDQQLHVLKRFWLDADLKDHRILKDAYARYAGKKRNARPDKNLTREQFNDVVKKVLKQQRYQAVPAAQQLLAWIDADNFLVKQRIRENSAIPHQLIQHELDLIIDNQRQYYPFLAEPNPVEERRDEAPYKLDELIAFRIPYYIGPLTEAGQNRFAWMIRKPDENGTVNRQEITPWNFPQMVDQAASANAFIRNMTAHDTYLLAEDVLPKASLLYQRFKVLDELNTIRINGQQRLTVAQKQSIYRDLFMQTKTVTVKRLARYMVDQKWFKGTDADNHASLPTISGLTDPKRFVSSLSSYLDLRRILGSQADNPKHYRDLERIIEWSTVFPSGHIYKEKLNELHWLGVMERSQLAGLHYAGWGRLSNRLLTKLYDNEGRSIMDLLWQTNQNFMQIISKRVFQAQLQAENAAYLSNDTLDSVLDRAYLSPVNKKAIRQALYVINDVQKFMGSAPKTISINFVRQQQSSNTSNERKKKFQKLYDALPGEFIKQHKERYQKLKMALKQAKTIDDRLYLYFQQFGTDLYTGGSLNQDDLDLYAVSPILPLNLTNDDSMNNKVLTARKVDTAEWATVRTKRRRLWDDLARAGLLPMYKKNRLLQDPQHLSDAERLHLLNRALNEKSTVARFTAALLTDRYPQIEVIEVRQAMIDQLRRGWQMPRMPLINDYDAGMDAYLIGAVGQYLYQAYPKLRSFFVYGRYQHTPVDSELKNRQFIRRLRDLNLLYPLVAKRKPAALSREREVMADQIAKEAQIVYGYHYMIVHQMATEFKGALFDATKVSHLKATDKFIPLKKGLPTTIYGGYAKSNMGFMTILCVEPSQRQKPAYLRVLGIRRIDSDRINQLLAANRRQEAEQAIIKAVQIYLTKGERQSRLTVVVPKVLHGQEVKTLAGSYQMSSFKYKRNSSQLILTPQTRWELYQAMAGRMNDEQAERVLLRAYDEVLSQLDHFTLFMQAGNQPAPAERLKAYQQVFEQLPLRNGLKGSDKLTIFRNILMSLHADAFFATLTDKQGRPIIKNFGLFSTTAISLLIGTKLWFSSPTGLHRSYKSLG